MEKPKYGRWPDVSAMKYFHKEGSHLWKKKLEELMINEDDAKIIWSKFTKGKVNKIFNLKFFFYLLYLILKIQF